MLNRTDSVYIDVKSFPLLTGANLKGAINNYRIAKGNVPSLFDSEGIKKLKEIYKSLPDKTGRIPTKKLMDVLLILVRTNPAEDILTSTVLSDLMQAFDGRVLAAVKGCVDLGGVNNGMCLVSCLSLMCANPDEALKIALAKSLLHVLLVRGAKSSELSLFYKAVNTDVVLASNIFLAVKTLGNFGYLFKNPDKAEQFFQQNMPKDNTEKLTGSGLTLFENKNIVANTVPEQEAAAAPRKSS